MRYFLRVLILFLGIVLDTTFMPAFSILGGFPLLSLVLVLAIAMSTGPIDTVITGAAVGAVLDLLYQPIFGINMLLFMYLALIVRAIYQYVYTKNIPMACLYAFVATFVYQGLYALLGFRLSGHIVTFLVSSLLRAAQNAVLMLPAYLLFRWLAALFQGKETL